MFKVWFISFEYFSQHESDTLDGALSIARKAGFECTIVDTKNDTTVGSWSPLYGFRRYL
jgi:7-cyano-7-deazaguanine synthase in queuosine biosynthesis